MKIYDRNLTGTSASETGQAQEAQNLSRTGKTNSHTRSGVDGSNDRVEFSGTLSQLSRALTAFESSRAKRVQALTADYRSGNYKPDSAATSKGLVAEAMSAGLPAGLQ
jgi:anti-sigma28 factor (negative regulator of flagellin synthesis)